MDSVSDQHHRHRQPAPPLQPPLIDNHRPSSVLRISSLPTRLGPLNTSLSSGTHATKVRRWVARDRAAHAAFLGVRWLSTDVVEAVIGVHGGVKFYSGAAKAARAYVERDRSRADDYYLGEGTGRRCPAHRDPGRGRTRRGDGRRDVRAVGRRDRRRHRSQEGPGPGRRQRAAVRRGHRQRTEDLVTGRGASPRHLGRARRSPGQGRHRDRGLGRRSRDDAGRAARTPGAGPGREDRGRGDPALHLPGRGPSPSPSPPDQRPRLRGRCLAGHPLRRDPRQHRGHQRDRARRCRDRPGSSGRSSRRTGSPSTRRPARSASSRRTSERSAPGPRRSAATSTATKRTGAPTTPARSRGRGYARRGTGGRGPKPDPTRSSRPTAPSSWPVGTASCGTSGTATRPKPWS